MEEKNFPCLKQDSNPRLPAILAKRDIHYTIGSPYLGVRVLEKNAGMFVGSFLILYIKRENLNL